MPAFKTAYLIHGDDHGRIAERRASLRELAQRTSGAQGLELYEGERSTPDNVAGALNAMTFALGRRFLIVDGVERWKDREMDALERALASIDPDTTVTFFAREDGRAKAPPRLHAALKRAGGVIHAEQAVKPQQLPGWAATQAHGLGLELTPEAARALVAHVGERQQRLLRELEKLALEFTPYPRDPGAEPAHIDVEMIEEITAASAQRKAWAFADVLLSGDAGVAARTLLAMRAQGERLSGLIFWLGLRVKQAHQAARQLEAGASAAQIRSGLRMPPAAADRLIADARRMGAQRLQRAVELVADLELASRGGSRKSASEDTEALLVIREIAA